MMPLSQLIDNYASPLIITPAQHLLHDSNKDIEERMSNLLHFKSNSQLPVKSICMVDSDVRACWLRPRAAIALFIDDAQS